MEEVDKDLDWVERQLAHSHGGKLGEAKAWDGGSGAAIMRTLILRLQEELAAEDEERERLGRRIASLENAVRSERARRREQIDTHAGRWEEVMKRLKERVEDGISAGAEALKAQTGQTEERLRELIRRADRGLSDGAEALQAELRAASSIAGNMPSRSPSPPPRSPSGPQPPVTSMRQAAEPHQASARQAAGFDWAALSGSPALCASLPRGPAVCVAGLRRAVSPPPVMANLAVARTLQVSGGTGVTRPAMRYLT